MAAVSGTTRNSAGVLTQKLVRVYRRDTGAYVGAALSDSTTGAWSVNTADTSEHFGLMHDAVGDPLFGETAFSLPLSSDLSDTRGHTFAANGGAAVSGGASVLDGAGDYLSCTSADFNPGSSDFTIEAWVRTTDAGVSGAIIANSNVNGSDNAFGLMLYAGGQVGFSVSANGSSNTSRDSAASVVPVNTWKHVACERYGNTLYLYIDGALSGSNVTFSSAVYANAQPLLIGSQRYNGSPNYFFKGSIKSARFTKGVARYKGAFTAPSAPYLEAVSGGTENILPLDRLTPV